MNVGNFMEQSVSYDRRSAADVEETEDVGELRAAEYLVFLFALETYVGWLEETSQAIEGDPTLRKGISLAIQAEKQIQLVQEAIRKDLSNPATQALLDAALRTPMTIRGFTVRALRLRIVLSKGGTATMKAIFGTSTKARREVQEAMEASSLSDPDAALKQLAAQPLKNQRMRAWIDLASDVVPPAAVVINAVQQAAKGATDASESILINRAQEESRPNSDASVAARDAQAKTLAQIEVQATETAKKALAQSGEEDRTLTKAEVIGVATATATAIASDPDKPQNIPPALRSLDPEQRAAAMTGGKVRVSAGAGSGKSTTLLARAQYLIDNGAVPNRMMAMSFNKKAADELATKMAVKIGSGKVSTSKNQNPAGVQVGTMHSTFLKFINQYGTPAQVNVFAKVNGKGGPVSASTVFKTVKDLWEECFPRFDKDPPGNPDPEAKTRTVPMQDLWKMPPKSNRMMSYMNYFQGQGWTAQQAREWAKTQTSMWTPPGKPVEDPSIEADQAAKFYEVYEGLKGSLGPGWRPNLCGKPSVKFQKFVDFYRAGKPRVGDFNDMLSIFRDILKTNPVARRGVQSHFDHIMIDECQDLNPLQFEIAQLMTEHIETDDPKRSFWMVGDDKQCVSEDTLVWVPGPDGSICDDIGGRDVKHAVNLVPGDLVVSYRNGELISQKVRHVKPSTWTWGYKITTESGKSLTMSPNHKIWADGPYLDDEQVAVYLMYRRDMGFRVGITNKCKDEDYLNSFGGRAFLEKAERMWILDVCPNREDALFLEESYSLTYGVPTMVFEGEHRGLNQDRIASIFDLFGGNGRKILEAKHLSFDLPHWLSQSYTKHGRGRRTVQMIAHGSKGTQVSLEWSGDDLDNKLEGTHYIKSDDRRRLRKWFTNYRWALEFAKMVASKTSANLSRRLSTTDGSVRLVTASGVFPGMKVVVADGDVTRLETVAEVEKVDGLSFVDLDVDDASNFFGGGILSHNSIYGFRGSDPENFIGLDKMGFKDRQITTNYRCAPEFIDAANRLIAHNANQIPMEAKPAPNRARGESSLVVSMPKTEAEAATEFGKKILEAVRKGEPLSNFAVLARTNGELAIYTQICAVLGTPFVQKKAASVFASQETETFRAFMACAVPKDAKAVQESFCQTLISGGILRPKFSQDRAENIKLATKAMKRAMAGYCSRSRISFETFDPVDEAVRSPKFVALMLEEVGGVPAYGASKDAQDAAPLLEGISQIRGYLEDPAFKSKDLFEAILDLPVVELTPPAPGERAWTKTEQKFRDSTSKRIMARIAQEDADEDPELVDSKSTLGTLSFISMMMEPNVVDPSYDPTNPQQFYARFEGLSNRAEELRIDPDEHEREQIKAGIPLSDRTPPPGVYLGTVHSTKGAEWHDVTLLMPQGKFPISRKPREPQENEVPEEITPGSGGSMESERRLGYVGLTRAKNSLTILCPGGASSFVTEAGLKEGQNVSRPETLTPGAEPATPADADPPPEDQDNMEWTQGDIVGEAQKMAGMFPGTQTSFAYTYDRSKS